MGSPVSLCDGGLDARRLVIGKSNGDLSSRETTEEDVFSGEEEEEEREWCGENRYCFYFVKQFAYDDPEIKAKIDEADNEIYNCNSERIHISNRLKAKRAERLTMESLMDQEGNSLTERLSEIKMEMELLDAQMSCVLDQRDRAFERIKFLRIQRDKGNAAFYQSRVVMKKAIELAASGNVRDLEELANSEVDKFMSRWNNDKAFREDYKKRILPSLEKRKLRRRVDTEDRDETAIELKRFSTEEEEEESDEKLQKEEEENLKEKKREEQLAKARQAMERKRKLHEKTAAKAAIKAKKEAEKKLKELEKRAKKKKKSSSSPSETVTEASEPEKKPLNGRTVSWNHRSFLRYRHHKKGNESVPKAILKRRRAYRLWVWSVSSAAIALPLALSILFFYVR